jgi:thiosulfate dehydrogenase [quinone] large subunit
VAKEKTKIGLVTLRLGMGWYFFYAGLSKILNPEWTSAGYLSGAKTLPGLFEWFAQAGNVGWVDFLNEWGLLLIGLSLILGLLVRYASIAGMVLMVFYWLPVLDFPYVGHGIIVDDHIIYMLVFYVFIKAQAGMHFGLDKKFLK